MKEFRAEIIDAKYVSFPKEFIDVLNLKGYLLSTQVKNVGRAIYDMSKNKIYTKKILRI